MTGRHRTAPTQLSGASSRSIHRRPATSSSPWHPSPGAFIARCLQWGLPIQRVPWCPRGWISSKFQRVRFQQLLPEWPLVGSLPVPELQSRILQHGLVPHRGSGRGPLSPVPAPGLGVTAALYACCCCIVRSSLLTSQSFVTPIPGYNLWFFTLNFPCSSSCVVWFSFPGWPWVGPKTSDSKRTSLRSA